MRIRTALFGLLAVVCLPMPAQTTWYVRPDGGTRYSSNVPTGQCDGQGDAAYPGSGVNQHCAFKDVRYLWQDGTYTYGTAFPGWGWVIAGGDTVILRGSIATGVSYRVGANSQTQYCDATGCWGITGSPAASGAPPIPSGTASQHTRFLGENYASCISASAKTQLHGGMAAGGVLNLSGSSYVDVACLDITDFSKCGRQTQSVGCDATQDYAQNGIGFSNTTTNVTVTDVHIHGMASAGITGPTGDGVVLTRVDLVGNASSGWNADAGDGTTGVGSLLVQNFLIWGNGCAEQYPLVYPADNSIADCTDQSSGGYGDGFGTATVTSPAPGWQVHFDQGVVAYNTQDGLDALHVNGPGSTMTVTRVLAYGNEGQQLKVGAGATATIQNSVVVGNCEAMTTVASIPTFAAGFGSKLASPCRAGNTAVLVNVTPGLPGTFQNNTIYEAGAIGLEVEYATSDQGPTNTLKYNNNIFVGFLNAGAGANSTPIYSNSDLKMLTNPGASWTNNATFGQRSNWACPQAGETKALCASPGLVDQSYHPSGYGDMSPATGSAVIGAGIAVAGITTDYAGNTRTNPPSIGAYEPQGTTAAPAPAPAPAPTPAPAPAPTPTPSLAADQVPAQQWTKVGQEGDQVAGKAGMTFRYGADAGVSACDNTTQLPGGWVTKTLTADTTFTAANDFFGNDPAYCQLKQVQVQMVSVPQIQAITDTVTKTVTPAPVSWTQTVRVGNRSVTLKCTASVTPAGTIQPNCTQ